MAPKYRQLIYLLLLMVVISFALIIFWRNDVFRFNEAALILASCLCAFISLRLHISRRCPESLVIIAATLIFLIAYVLQSILFITNSHSNPTTTSELISIRSVFSVSALNAGPIEVEKSLVVVFTGFIGILLSAVYFSLNKESKSELRRYEKKLSLKNQYLVSNALAIGYVAILIIIFFGLLRKYLGLDSPSPSGLPMGIGAIINIASAYIGPNLLLAALFYALEHNSDDKARYLIFLSIALGLFNYLLFTSKMSLILPVLYIVVCQYLLGRHVISIRAVAFIGGIFLIIYPFLNLYRSALALGVSPRDLMATIIDLYQHPNEASDVERSVLQIAIGAIIGRFVGYDPLLILLQANPYPDSLLDYFLYGDLDKYLTYTILDFQEGMGYSPGFLGRLFYISDSYIFLLISTIATTFIIATFVRIFWRGRNKFLTPLLLTYCLVFFSDGIRFELIRALLLSSIFICGLLSIFPKHRVTKFQKNKL
jgi:hypothetical protein